MAVRKNSINFNNYYIKSYVYSTILKIALFNSLLKILILNQTMLFYRIVKKPEKYLKTGELGLKQIIINQQN